LSLLQGEDRVRLLSRLVGTRRSAGLLSDPLLTYVPPVVGQCLGGGLLSEKELHTPSNPDADPVSAFLEAASVPRHGWHASGDLKEADMMLERHPEIAKSDIYTASVLADAEAVRALVTVDSAVATGKGGPYSWDALTYLCFSRYLRLDRKRSDAFVQTARILLDAGASAQTGWYEPSQHGSPIFESVIYGAAGIARHPGLTKLLLERGADPNDEETPYHVPETDDNTVMRILLESETLNQASLACMLLRKADWHDEHGMQVLLAYGADPNLQRQFGFTSLHQSVRRDNRLSAIKLLLDNGADPTLASDRTGQSAAQIAAQRGRADVLELLEERSDRLDFSSYDALVAACARSDRRKIDEILEAEPAISSHLLAGGATLLSEFAGNGNVGGLRCLLDLGVPVDSRYPGDAYFDIAPESTALHVAAWRAHAGTVALLIERGAEVNARDAKARTPLQLAVRACVNSYWMSRRTPDCVATLLKAGASRAGIELPTGYEEIDRLLEAPAV
jgi:ankyrin repeat protein